MHPVLAELPTPWGPLPLQAHGACLALALVAGWYLFVGPPHAVPRARRGRLYLALALGALAGGALLAAAATGAPLFAAGFHAPGALLGAAFALWVAGGDDRPALARHTAPLAPLLTAGAALGAWLHGAGFGVRFGAPPWVEALGTYPRWPDGTGAPAWRAHLEAGWIDADTPQAMKTFLDANRASMAEDHEGTPVFMARNAWHLNHTQENAPDIRFHRTKENAGEL